MNAEFRPYEHRIIVSVSKGVWGRAVVETRGHTFVGDRRVSGEEPSTLIEPLSKDKSELLALILTPPKPKEA
mgnify:CR=1 FL=1